MAGGEVSWNNLPIVILNEVFNYLPLSDKISSSSTCKNWRLALSHPSCWRNVHFYIKSQEKSENIERTRFLIQFASRKIHSARISFDSMDTVSVEEIANVLEHLSENRNLRGLIFKPSNCSLVCPAEHGDWPKYIERNYGFPLLSIVQKSHRLEVFSLGCLEDLVTSLAKPILETIANKPKNSLKVLGLASIKDYPDYYAITDLNINLLKPLKNLQILSIDYCHVNDSLLQILGEVHTLERLVVHVHGVSDDHQGTSESAWTHFTHKLPRCGLRLTLIHSYDGIDCLHTKILKKAMPLTHLKVFFCERLNLEAAHALSFYSDTLRSVWWVDSASCEQPFSLTDHSVINPFIMCAWRCQNLDELVFLGHKYLHIDVNALVRLSNGKLRNLCLSAADMVFVKNRKHNPTSDSQILAKLQEEVSRELRRPWAALVEPQLHPVIWNSNAGDSDEFVLPIVLRDIEP